ncbi:hypothetical protein D9758_010707 [Tetrapyrgos nigripes]|uniref:NACHT domain-containing protein n=1 Tax=Tetrapyrgos nigripes TaxID=182062 RepID=A0A8H5GGS0_9AGAR|nr:hypothetical protein D9758_010707 [Tetrapyrgos nigripes]
MLVIGSLTVLFKIFGSLFNNSSKFIISQSTINVVSGDQYNTQSSGNNAEWIKAPNPFENFNAAYPKIVEGTGTWLLDHESFERWKNNLNGSLLWLQGKAGSGKTFLCTNVINDLRKNSSVFFYYFDTRDKVKADYQGFISSLLCQVAKEAIEKGDTSAQNELEKLYNSSKKGDFLVAENIEATLIHMLMVMGAAYVIVDAMDECTGQYQGKILALVEKLLTTLKNCYVFVSSRPQINIAHKEVQIISLDKQTSDIGTSSDIEKYVDIKLQEQCSWTPELKDEIKDTLVNGANGQIRWVDCQLTALDEIKMPRRVRKALKSLPKTLQETYAKILEQVNEELREDVKTILQWLLFAYRPLNIAEIQHILAVDVEEERFLPVDLLENIETELHKVVNSSFVVIIQASIETYYGRKQTVMTVQLAHPSVKDYLLSEVAIQSASGYFQMNSALVHEVICQTCIIYLLCCGHVSIDVEKYALAHYASKYWFLHSNETKEESSAILNLSYQLLNSTQPAYYNWLNVYTPDTWDNKPRGIAKPLYYASYIGLKSVVVYMLKDDNVDMYKKTENVADINGKGGHEGNALQAANYGGHLEVVKLLCEGGTDVNAQGGRYRNALQAASHGGHLEVVKLLCENGADVNAQGEGYGNALQAASREGHLGVVKLLLENGADINAQCGPYENALQAASKRGHLDVVKLLCENGADVNAQGGGSGHALQAASCGGHLEVVKLLCENGADANAQGGFFGHALQAASLGGHLEVVKLLCENGTDVNANGGRYGNALQAASSGGHLEVVKLLYENGADVNVQGGPFQTALQAASVQGHLKVVEILLEKGADISAPGRRYFSALHAAQSNGHSEVIAALLRAGADDNVEQSK